MRRCPYCFKTLGKDEICGCNYPKSDNAGIEAALPPGTQIGGDYLIGAVLGQGGFGITYKGFDVKLEKVIAIKEFFPKEFVTRERLTDPDGTTHFTPFVQLLTREKNKAYQKARKMFIREARALAKLNKQDNIVHIHRIFEENETIYFVMDHVSGKSLKQILNEKGRFPESELLPLLDPVLLALEQVHGENLLHRDIAPDNIIIDESGQPVLLDFGAAKPGVDPGWTDAARNESSLVVEKKGYTPIEQMGGLATERSDIYAMGAVYYHLLSGTVPPEAYLRRADRKKDPLVPLTKFGISKKTNDAIMKALAYEPEDRWKTVAEFRAALSVTHKGQIAQHNWKRLLISAVILMMTACGVLWLKTCRHGSWLPFFPTETFVPTDTLTPTTTNTPEPTETPTPTTTDTSVPTDTLTPTVTDTPAPTETPTPTATDTPVPTDTPMPTATDTPIPTETPTPTATNTPVPTDTPMPTVTNTPASTDTPIPTMTDTPVLIETQRPARESLQTILNPGDIFTFGKYGEEPIEWIILETDFENQQALLLSRYALEEVKFNSTLDYTNWEHASLRMWLNSDFLSGHFSDEEQAQIVSSVHHDVFASNIVTDERNRISDTEDRVFLLTRHELNLYLHAAKSLTDGRCSAASYTVSEDGKDHSGTFVWWWLRDNYSDAGARVIRSDGTDSGSLVNNDGVYLRPVIRLSLGDNYRTEPAGLIPEKTEFSSSSEDLPEIGTVLQFGQYETDNDISNGQEPIEWLVLDMDKENRQALVVSQYVLEQKRFHDFVENPVTWENCTLRAWLNEDFMNEHFSNSERERIRTVSNSTYDDELGIYLQSNDSVFLLSEADVAKYFPTSSLRKCEFTAYSHAKRQWDPYAIWWVRKSGNSTGRVVDSSGNYQGVLNYADYVFVRPALWLGY